MTPAEELTHILDTYHLYRLTTPCSRCGDDIFSHWLRDEGVDQDACVFCYPPKGFHIYGKHLYQVHPRPKTHQ